jgi:hypothetical protein
MVVHTVLAPFMRLNMLKGSIILPYSVEHQHPAGNNKPNYNVNKDKTQQCGPKRAEIGYHCPILQMNSCIVKVGVLALMFPSMIMNALRHPVRL